MMKEGKSIRTKTNLKGGGVGGVEKKKNSFVQRGVLVADKMADKQS